MTCPRFSIAVGAWVLFATGFLAAPAHGAPTFKGISAIATAANGAADPTVTLPAHAANDVFLLVTMVRSNASSVATPSGWTQIGSPTVRSTNATYQFFWMRAASGSETNPLINRTGTTGDVYGAVISYSGAFTTGDPWEVKGTPATGTSDPATCTGITTLTAESLVVAALAGEDNNNSAVTTTGTNPAAYTTHYLETATGADGMIAFSEEERTAAGATGSVSVDFNTANPIGWGCVVLALKPAPAPTLSSAGNQSFTIGDPPALASTLTVTEHATTASITAANDIRIRIPASFNMTWDTAVTSVTLGGSASGKASATLSAYEDSNRTAVLNVTSNFAASDQITITGLKFRNFTATSAADNLELVVAGSGGTTADEDDKTIAIVNNDPKSAGSRILNDNASRTPVAAEDVDVTNWDKSTKFLVTIGIQTTATDCRNSHGTNKIEWRNVTDAPGTWNTLGTGAAEMKFFASTNLAPENALTSGEAQIVGTGGYVNGEEAENNTADSVNWARFRNGQHSAIQFAVDPSGGIDGRTYQFRFIVDTLCSVAAGTNVMSVSVTLAIAAPGGFNAYETSTGAGAITGNIKTKIAGSAATVDMIALNPAKTAIHTPFTGTVRVEVLNASDNSGALDATGCRPSWSVIQTLSPDPAFVTGDNGRKAISFTQANSYPNARLRITYPAGAPTVTGCSTDNFAIRPNAFAGLAVTDLDAQSAGLTRTLNDLTFTVPGSGGIIHKAGQPLSVRATAQNAASATTTNYSGTPTGTLTSCTGAACTTGFGTFSLGTAFSAGQLTSDVATYDNVGSFRLELVDSAFASVDASDSSALEREIRSGTLDVGRFVPDHFAVAVSLIPGASFAAACGTFTYIGQVFNYSAAPSMTVTAQNLANGTTTLYVGNWWRISNGSLTPNSQAARYSAATANTLDTTLLPAVAADPAIDSTTPGSGVGTLTFSSGSGLAFTRPTSTPTAPVAPFDADISLAVNVIDADGVAYASNPARFGVATTGNGIAFTGGKAMRFGVLRLENAVGSEKMDLPVGIQTQYYTGATFTRNTDDNCTSINAANAAFSSYFGGITAANMNGGNVTGLGANFSSGSGSLTLTKPSPTPGSAGAVTLTIDLSAAAKSYLKGNWGVPTYTADPSSRDAFGLYGIQNQPNSLIYFRENY